MVNINVPNGNEPCERTKIEYGDLNSYIVITYHVDGEVCSYSLFFHANSPITLIMNGVDGYETKYFATNLKDALCLRDKKTIKDY